MTQQPRDILDEAARALREETASESSAARFTRLRVMASLRESEVRRRTRTVLLLPFAACLAVTAAWGMASGGISEMRTAVVKALGLEVAAPKAPEPAKKGTPRPKSAARGPSAPSAPAPSAPAPSEPSVPSVPTPSEPAPSVSPPAAVLPAPAPLSNKSGAVPRRTAISTPKSDATHELYRAAHRAHFIEQDWNRALSAWDGYLAAAPGGQLATEARYNRALCLVRLGRVGEARRALAAFADTPGAYRQKEASALIGVLPEN